MSAETYKGVTGVNRKVKEIYRGVDGVNRKVKENWRCVNGVNQKVFSGFLIPIRFETLNLSPDATVYALTAGFENGAIVLHTSANFPRAEADKRIIAFSYFYDINKYVGSNIEINYTLNLNKDSFDARIQFFENDLISETDTFKNLQVGTNKIVSFAIPSNTEIIRIGNWLGSYGTSDATLSINSLKLGNDKIF